MFVADLTTLPRELDADAPLTVLFTTALSR
jgi:hypothetical protein